MATRFMGTCNCWHDLVFFLGVGLLKVRIFSLYSHNGNWPSVSSITICDGILFSELGFFEMFLCSTSWAIALYFKQRWSKDEVEDFSSLADHHKEWAQVWFSISISIFLGGLTYAIFHVAESSFLQCSVPVSVYDKAAANERELTALAQELLRNVKDGADEKEL